MSGRYRGTDPPVGSWGEVYHEGLWFSYIDMQMSGEILHDSPNCPDWVREDQAYWVRHAIGGMRILGPVLRIEPEAV